MPGPNTGLPTSAEKVAMMQRLRSLGWTGDEIARELNVCRDTVYRRTKP